MLLSLLSMILAASCPISPDGCPDYESQRAAEVDDSLTYIQDSLDDVAELAEEIHDSATVATDRGLLHLLNDGSAYLETSAGHYATDTWTRRRDGTYILRIAAAECYGSTMDDMETCNDLPRDSVLILRPVRKSVAEIGAPVLVALASRNPATEPERATTCYVGLDCPEDRN